MYGTLSSYSCPLFYQSQASSTKLTVENYSKHSEDLELKMATKDSMVDHLKHTVDKLNTELEDNRKNLDQQVAMNLHDKVKYIL